jgi:hypothetical protein
MFRILVNVVLRAGVADAPPFSDEDFKLIRAKVGGSPFAADR